MIMKDWLKVVGQVSMEDILAGLRVGMSRFAVCCTFVGRMVAVFGVWDLCGG